MSVNHHAKNAESPPRDDRTASGDKSKNQTAQKRPRKGRRLYAALDLGTNNCRLLIVERDGNNGFLVRDGFSRIVRLGEGLERSGR